VSPPGNPESSGCSVHQLSLREGMKKREIRELRRLIQRETIKESLGGDQNGCPK